MTKRELVERLAEFPDDAEIKISIHRDEETRTTGVNKLELFDPPAWGPPALFLSQQ